MTYAIATQEMISIDNIVQMLSQGNIYLGSEDPLILVTHGNAESNTYNIWSQSINGFECVDMWTSLHPLPLNQVADYIKYTISQRIEADCGWNVDDTADYTELESHTIATEIIVDTNKRNNVFVVVTQHAYRFLVWMSQSDDKEMICIAEYEKYFPISASKDEIMLYADQYVEAMDDKDFDI